MARGENWSREEVEATVADYFRMLELELAGQPFNKSTHRRQLQGKLGERSEASIELKHQNISAVLIEMNCVYISGYKPRGNYQQLLASVVQVRLEHDPAFDGLALQAVERVAVAPDIVALKDVLVDAPRIARVSEPKPGTSRARVAIRRDYLERESRNRSLGLAGEQFVVEFEARRLHAAGYKALADRVDHVAATRGDGLGYDILSYEPSGKERFIEVKTTAFGIATPFYVSRNEVAFSEEQSAQFVLARVHEFRAQPKLFELRGSIRSNVQLDPVSYLARC